MDVTGNRAIAAVRADMPSRTRTVTVQLLLFKKNEKTFHKE